MMHSIARRTARLITLASSFAAALAGADELEPLGRMLHEPNPLVAYQARALKFLPVRYPEQSSFPARRWHYDCEAVFHADGKLYFVTKHRKAGEITGWAPGARLYRLDTTHTSEVNELTFVGASDAVRLATGADLSPDGSRLALATYEGVWLFARPEQGDNWLAGTSRFIELDRKPIKTFEAITWLNDRELLLANEERDLYRLRPSRLP